MPMKIMRTLVALIPGELGSSESSWMWMVEMLAVGLSQYLLCTHVHILILISACVAQTTEAVWKLPSFPALTSFLQQMGT